MSNSTTDAYVSSLSQKETINEKEARECARECLAGMPVAKAGKNKGFGFQALLRIGALVLALLKKAQDLASGETVTQTFTFLGEQRWIRLGSGTPPP